VVKEPIHAGSSRIGAPCEIARAPLLRTVHARLRTWLSPSPGYWCDQFRGSISPSLFRSPVLSGTAFMPPPTQHGFCHSSRVSPAVGTRNRGLHQPFQPYVEDSQASVTMQRSLPVSVIPHVQQKRDPACSRSSVHPSPLEKGSARRENGRDSIPFSLLVQRFRHRSLASARRPERRALMTCSYVALTPMLHSPFPRREFQPQDKDQLDMHRAFQQS